MTRIVESGGFLFALVFAVALKWISPSHAQDEDVAWTMSRDSLKGVWIVNTCFYGSSRPIGSPEAITIGKNTITAGLHIEKPFDVIVETPELVVLKVAGGRSWYEDGEISHYLRLVPAPRHFYTANKIKRRIEFSDYRNLEDAKTANPQSRQLSHRNYILDIEGPGPYCTDLAEPRQPAQDG